MLRHSVSTLHKLLAACFAVAAIAVQPVFAQPQQDAASAQTEAGDSSAHLPELTLQATASSEVRQDTVRITLSTEVDAPDQPGAGKKLTAALDEVVKQAKGVEHVDVRTGAYNVWPNTNSKGKVVGWRGQGQIILESKNFEAASALAAKLGDKTAISNISFSLSREGREAQERKLLNQAAQAFRERALAAASAFGFSGYRIGKLALSGSGAPAPMNRMVAAPMMMAKGAEADAAVPLEADEVTVSVAVEGTIFLQ